MSSLSARLERLEHLRLASSRPSGLFITVVRKVIDRDSDQAYPGEPVLIVNGGKSWRRAQDESLIQFEQRVRLQSGLRDDDAAIYLPDNGRESLPSVIRRATVGNLYDGSAPGADPGAPSPVTRTEAEEAPKLPAVEIVAPTTTAATTQATAAHRSLICPLTGRRESIADAFARARSPFATP